MKRLGLFFFIALLAALISASAQPPLPLPHDGRQLGDVSGIVIPSDTEPISYAEAIDSNHSLSAPLLLVGSPDKAPGGEAQILAWDNTTWSPIFYPAMPVPIADARFGASVAMYGVEDAGAVAVVGAPDFNDDGGTEVGAAFVYRHIAGSWQLVTELYPPGGSDVYHFGTAVEVVGEGDFATIIVSAPDVDHNGFTNVGAIYTYTWNSTDGDYMLDSTLYSGATQNDERMGVALGADSQGASIIIAASADMPDDSGQVYVFHYDTGTWSPDETLVSPNDVANGRFGADLDFEWWNDEALLVVGEPGGTYDAVSNAGRAYIYGRNTTTTDWALQDSLQADSPTAGAAFGESVALSGMYASPVILVGEPLFDVLLPSLVEETGRVYIYRDVGFWYSQQSIYSTDTYAHFGASVEAVGYDQSGWIFVGAPTAFNPTPTLGDPGSGALYFYSLDLDPVPPTEFTWVSNGSFETAGASPYLPDGWILRKRLPGDGRSCGAVAGSGGVPGDKAYDGLCAFKFRGNLGKKATLIYAITKPDLDILIGQPISTDDSLRLTLRYKMKANSKPLVRLIGWRAPLNIAKFYHKVQTRPVGENYGDWHLLDIEVPITDTNFVELRLIIKDKSQTLTWWADDVEAIYVIDGNTGGGERRGTDIPDGFRAP